MKTIIYIIKKTIVSNDETMRCESIEGIFKYDEYEKACKKIGMLFFDIVELPAVIYSSFDEINEKAIIRTDKDTCFLSLIAKTIEL